MVSKLDVAQRKWASWCAAAAGLEPGACTQASGRQGGAQGGRLDRGLLPVVRIDVGDAGDGAIIIPISSHLISSWCG